MCFCDESFAPARLQSSLVCLFVCLFIAHFLVVSKFIIFLGTENFVIIITVVLQEDEESQSVKRAKSLIDPSFIVYKKVLLVMLILLFVAVMLGVLFEFTRKPLQRWLNLSSQTSGK